MDTELTLLGSCDAGAAPTGPVICGGNPLFDTPLALRPSAPVLEGALMLPGVGAAEMPSGPAGPPVHPWSRGTGDGGVGGDAGARASGV